MASDPGQLDVDARFLLANERTLLAWVRTALALLAGAAGLQSFGEGLAARTELAALLAGAGVLAALAGAVRHARADRALRLGLLPATGLAPYVLSGLVVVLGLGLVVAVLLT